MNKILLSVFLILLNFVLVDQVLWSCEFEDAEGLSETCGLIQEGGDQFDWSLMTGPTPSELTGPDAAATGSYYMYIEASSPRVSGDEAR